MFKFVLFQLGFLTAMFNKQELLECITRGTQGGYRFLRREFSIEPRRVLFFFKALSFGIVFKKEEGIPDYSWRIGEYRTRFFTKTVDTRKLASTINEAAKGGYEMFYSMKYPTRFLFFFPREAYFFVFRKPGNQETVNYEYAVEQTPYRFFSKTIDEQIYTQALNKYAASSTFKISFRDERRVFGLFMQPTVVSIWEQER